MMMRDRVQELRRVPASELRANPKNWRTHPPAQQAAIRGIIEDIGFADAVLARETDDGLELIDGHLRQEVMGDQEVPVLIIDVTEEEADKMLLTLDPLAAMATSDDKRLKALLSTVSSDDDAVGALLRTLANDRWVPLILDELPGPPVEDVSGTLLQLLDITIAEPRHKVSRGELYRLGSIHVLACASVIKDWALWAEYLTGDVWFCPHPNPMVPLSEEALTRPMLLVQPDPYTAGHILDRYEDIYGSTAIEQL